MDIFFEKEGTTRTIRFSGSVCSLLKRFNLNPEEVIVVRNDDAVLESDILYDGDTVRILSVISGG